MLQLVTGDSPRVLLDHLADTVASGPVSLFDDETIVVQSRGMERWIRQQLAERHGCAASLALPFPAAFCRRLAQSIRTEPMDPRFDEDALIWRVDAWLSEATHLDDAIFSPLRSYLTDADPLKRFRLSQQIAGRLDEYRLYRPHTLLTWEARGVAPEASTHERWQGTLWRDLTAGNAPWHFARWFTETIATLANATEAPAGLPRRVAIFGVSTLPPLFVDLLRALARFIPVTCYVFVPTANGWQPDSARHPLDEAFGASTRDLLTLLADGTNVTSHLHLRRRDLAPSMPDAQPSLLHQVQTAIVHGVASPTPTHPIVPTDRSLIVHDCHSPVRELEVLRDQLLDAFAEDPTLRPHDILVMVPDVELYASLAPLVFGDSYGRGQKGRPTIPYRIADRALPQDASPAQALLQGLALVESRFTAPEVLDLLAITPVQRSAGFTPPQLDRVMQWLTDADIRWGIDGTSRAEETGMPPLDAFSWREGLDRLLLGYATGRVPSPVIGLAPVAGDVSGDLELLGAFIAWTDQLMAWRAQLALPRRLQEWPERLEAFLRWLVNVDSGPEAAALDQLRRIIERVGELGSPELTGEANAQREVPFAIVWRWVQSLVDTDQQDTGFLSGGMTLCAMKPMRAIPFRVIAVLGLQDTEFPRRDRRPAFDLIGEAPVKGDRDPRLDDRQLLLDTLLCAGSRLILSFVGRSQTNNAEIAPSVVVSELLTHLAERYAARPVVQHALQPYDGRYFDGQDAHYFSYDDNWADSAQAAEAARRAATVALEHPAPFVADRLHAEPMAHGVLSLTLDELIACWSDPARFHCRQVLGLSLKETQETVEEVEPFLLDHLGRYQLREALLEQRSAHPDWPVEAIRARVMHATPMPPGALTQRWYRHAEQEVQPLLDRLQAIAFAPPQTVQLHGADWQLTGTLDRLGTDTNGDAQWLVRPAKVRTKDRIAAWIRHLVSAAARHTEITHLIGLDRSIRYTAVADPLPLLEWLIAGYRETLHAPLPYFPRAAEAWWKVSQGGDPGAALSKAQAAFTELDNFGETEVASPYVALLWRGREPLVEQADRFAALVHGLWAPMTSAERRK